MRPDAGRSLEQRRHEELRLRFLLGRAAGSDREALIELHGLLSERLSRLLLVLGLPAESVADALADSLVDIWRRPISIGASRRALCGIAAVTYRHGLRALRRASPRCSPRIAAADASLDCLPLAQRAVLGLIHGVGCSGDEVAHILQCPLASVIARMRLVRRALRTPARTAPEAGAVHRHSPTSA